jgi:hypothetical protein
MLISQIDKCSWHLLALVLFFVHEDGGDMPLRNVGENLKVDIYDIAVVLIVLLTIGDLI